MGDSTVTIIAIFLAAILMFLVPLISITERGDDISQTVVQTALATFVNDASSNGFISKANYDKLNSSLSATGNTYDIVIEVQKIDENPGKKATVTSGNLIGENIEYSVFTSTILETIDSPSGNGRYDLNQGDKIIVTATNTNTTLAQMFRNFMYKITGNDKAIGASASALVTRTSRSTK